MSEKLDEEAWAVMLLAITKNRKRAERAEAKLTLWREAVEKHLLTGYVLWDNAVIDHLDYCGCFDEW